MGAVAIYICHDCKLATYTPTDSSVNHYAKIGSMADRVYEEFKKEHPGHDVAMKSDCHGQISACDYDFEKREFKWDL